MPISSIRKPAGMVRRTELATRVFAAFVGAMLAVLAGHAALFRIGESLVSLSYDMPFIVHRPGSTDDLRIVYLEKLDEAALDRKPQGGLLDKLGEAGAKAVIYDIIFDRESKDPAVDKEFAEAIRRFRGVDSNGNAIPGMPQRHVLLACGRKTYSVSGLAGEQLIPPTESLRDAADDFGIAVYDDEGYRMIRKLSTGSPDQESLIWKSAVALGASLSEDNRLDSRWINFVGPPPGTKDNSSSGSIPSCKADSVLQGGMNPNFFLDKVVIIGGEPSIFGEGSQADKFQTPFHRFQIGDKLPYMSGVEVQANGLANLMQGNWLTRSSHKFEFGLILTSGIILGIGLTFLRPLRGMVAAATLVVLLGIAGVFSMHYERIWFPWSVVAFLQVPVALVWGIAAHSYIERFFRIKLSAEQAAIRAAFAKYLSPQMLDRLTIEGFNTDLGGENVQAAMMFTDLEAFTDMCERVANPQRIVETLNGYFERTTGSIFDDDGVIVKFIGDAIFAAWGAPLPDPDAPVKAVRAAWNLYQSDKLMVDGLELRTRIGLHFGEVVAGNIGSSRRVDYTLIGDAVNLTARLEGINKQLDTSILMSDAIHSKLDGEFRTRRVGQFRVKGRKEVVIVYELLGPARQAHEPEWITQYHQALAALDRNESQMAFDLFTSVNTSRGPRGDGPSRYFIEQIKKGEDIRDGIVDLKEK